MASLRKRVNNGTWEIQFRDEYGRKKTITLSGRKYKERIARQFKDAVDVLVDKKINRDPTQHAPTKTWVENAPAELREKLARFDLCKANAKCTIQELWDKFFDRYEFKAEGTRQAYYYVRKNFFPYFRGNEYLDELTSERMTDWKSSLLEDYAEATVAGVITKTKTLFNWAKEQKWIAESPMDGVGRGSYENPDNERFITMTEYQRLLDACRCQEWRTIITLARIGGLHPNEILTLRWSDIGKWSDTVQENRFRVSNSKLR